jgi:hypothetical protein
VRLHGRAGGWRGEDRFDRAVHSSCPLPERRFRPSILARSD